MYSSISTMKLIRYAVAYVFITAGVVKLLNEQMANVFIGLGLPYPHQVLYIVALLEIICGILLIANKYVKEATIPLLVIIIGAILLTKIPLLHSSFFVFAMDARLDVVMLVLLFILYNKHR